MVGKVAGEISQFNSILKFEVGVQNKIGNGAIESKK